MPKHPPHLIMILFIGILMLLTHIRNNDWQDGVLLWGKVTRSGYRKARGYYNLGINYRKKGQLEDAIEKFTMAITIDPGHVNAYVNRGNAYDDMGSPNEAIENYHKALRMAPRDDYIHYNLGITYRRAGREEDAVSHFQRSCDLGNAHACRAIQTRTERNHAVHR